MKYISIMAILLGSYSTVAFAGDSNESLFIKCKQAIYFMENPNTTSPDAKVGLNSGYCLGYMLGAKDYFGTLRTIMKNLGGSKYKPCNRSYFGVTAKEIASTYVSYIQQQDMTNAGPMPYTKALNKVLAYYCNK